MARKWTMAEIADVLRLVTEGQTYREIATTYKSTTRAISGVVFRHRHPTYEDTRAPRLRREVIRKGPRGRAGTILKPSKTPYAPDSSCPEFAWDEPHCEAVAAAGGFPVMPRRAA